MTIAAGLILSTPNSLAGAPPPIAEAVAPIAPPGTVIVRLAGNDTDDLTDNAPFADAVRQALGDANFTPMPEPGHSRYIADVSVARAVQGIVTARARKDPASAGIGSFGPAVRVPLGSKKTVLRNLVVTTLTVRIVMRDDGRPVWSGSAVTAQAEGMAVAGKLARAVVSAWPRTLSTPVSVP